MKKRNLVKILTITLCLSAIFSTVAMAKENDENKQYKSSKASVCAIVPHPTEDDFPD